MTAWEGIYADQWADLLRPELERLDGPRCRTCGVRTTGWIESCTDPVACIRSPRTPAVRSPRAALPVQPAGGTGGASAATRPSPAHQTPADPAYGSTDPRPALFSPGTMPLTATETGGQGRLVQTAAAAVGPGKPPFPTAGAPAGGAGPDPSAPPATYRAFEAVPARHIGLWFLLSILLWAVAIAVLVWAAP